METKCSTCGETKAIDAFYPSVLKQAWKQCKKCHQAGMKMSADRLKMKKKEDPWIQKIGALRRKAESIENRKLWTTESAKRLFAAFKGRCALTGDEVDERQFTFIKLNPSIDFIPTNAVVVRRWNTLQTRSDSFEWSAMQRERIREAHALFVA